MSGRVDGIWGAAIERPTEQQHCSTEYCDLQEKPEGVSGLIIDMQAQSKIYVLSKTLAEIVQLRLFEPQGI